jgi:glyoxylase-like metal-dependent hydrolase (beta-lactamase superfamily II)
VTVRISTETWRIGDVTISKVQEVYNRVPVATLFANADTSRIDEARWLRPHYIDESNVVGMSVHSFLVQTPTMQILVDTCGGNNKPRSYQAMSMLNTPYLDRLAAAGASPESIDRVLCTHLHFDHVGWNTRMADGKWVATFPNARYVFARAEWEFWCAQPNAQDQFDSAVVLADSVWPLDASVIDLVDDGDAVGEHVRVRTFAGHTPGHLCIWIASGGEQAVITGDVIHSPLQFVEPAWHGRADVGLGESLTARRHLIEQIADTDVLLLGTHFPAPSGGLVRRDGSGWRFESGQ